MEGDIPSVWMSGGETGIWGDMVSIISQEAEIPSDVKTEGCFMNVKPSEKWKVMRVAFRTHWGSKSFPLLFTFTELQALGRIPGRECHPYQFQQPPRWGSCQYFFLPSKETEAWEVKQHIWGHQLSHGHSRIPVWTWLHDMWLYW